MKIFVAGPRAVSTLNKNATDVLSRMIEKQLTVLVGDANGVDRLVQKYFAEAKYPHVNVYASNGKARNNLGNWSVLKVEVPKSAKGFQFYAQKDIQMARDADNGFMIWNGRSKGTLNNIINLTAQSKKVVIYLLPLRRIQCIDKLEDVEKLAEHMGPKTLSIFYELAPKSPAESAGVAYEQLSF